VTPTAVESQRLRHEMPGDMHASFLVG